MIDTDISVSALHHRVKRKGHLHDRILLERVHDGLQNKVKRKDRLPERVLHERVLHERAMGYIIE